MFDSVQKDFKGVISDYLLFLLFYVYTRFILEFSACLMFYLCYNKAYRFRASHS